MPPPKADNTSSLDATEEKNEDPAQLSKRKKHLDNLEGGIKKLFKRPKYDWSQSNEGLVMTVKVENLKAEDLKDLNVEFTDTDIYMQLSGDKDFTWTLRGEIIKEESKVKVKKQKIMIFMKKKDATHWDRFESENEAHTDNEPMAKTPQVDRIIMDQVTSPTTEMVPDSIPDNDEQTAELVKEKEEEPVEELGHIKHDFTEKQDTFVVHIYVKGVHKDNLVVKFEETNFKVKFQTSHISFLKLHPNSTEETKFTWNIKLKGEIVPDNSKYKLTGSCIELYLAKKSFGRWGDLEAPQHKVPATKTDSWVSVKCVKPKEEETDDVVFDDMKQKDNLVGKSSRTTPAMPSAAKSADAASKPTCKVQPLNKQPEVKEQVVTPGYTGLDNLGNTCFMNGVLQCLVNTRELRDFFLSGSFQTDLNTENVLGSGGKLAVAFAVLMKVLWSGKHFSYAPSKLKNLVAQKASQFTGFAQHDAQEFLAFLLDGLHEDLNRIKKKPYTETVEDKGRPDEVVAAEAWAVHRRRNDSMLVDLFQGQYKSKLVCPKCGKVSITFDPFLYLSLPLPKRQRLLPITFMWKDPYRKPVRYMLRLSKEATVENLKDSLHKKTGIQPNNLRVFEAYKGRIHKMFNRGSNLSLVQATDHIIVCEVLAQEMAGESVYEIAVVQRTLMPNEFPVRCQSCKKLCPEGSKLKRCTKCFKVGYCDQTCQKNHWQQHRGQCKSTPEPVGTPFIISIPESRATFSKLCQLMEAYARYSVDVFQPPVKTDPAPKLSSHLSSSSLSNSSQSSGSLNSLDSQSSFSSSCTITAEQEQNLDENDLANAENDGKFSQQDDKRTSPIECDAADLAGASVSTSNPETTLVDKDQVEKGTKSTENSATVNKDQTRADSGYQSLGDVKASGSNVVDKDMVSPVNAVLGIQTGDMERTTPMFFIKPVNSDGIGLTGVDGERLEDKGETTLDLTNKFFLSVDWKNNDKLPGYVLVQSKEMDYDNDSSMQTASLEENNSVTLEQCLELFTEPEVLSPEEAWYCPTCKEHREATKQLSTWKLPHTLIIQLKRFSFRNFIWRDKIDKMVDFPTRGLDLSAYYLGSHPAGDPPPVYDLYGVVNHHGGILGGHYTSYVRCADLQNHAKNDVGWHLCDDSRVSSISHEKNVVTRAAYLLFYRKRAVFVPQPSAGISEPEEAPTSVADTEVSSPGGEEYSSDGGGDLVIDTTPRADILDMPDIDVADHGDAVGSVGSTVIDTTPRADILDMPDIDVADHGDAVGGVVSTDVVPEIQVDDNEELQYTDMDSVD